jgi:hypothetical protein
VFDIKVDVINSTTPEVPLSANFTYEVQANNVVKFTNTSSVNNSRSVSYNWNIENGTTISHQTLDDVGSEVSYYWQFGDGQFSYEVEPEHQYENIGIYTVIRETYQEGKLVQSKEQIVDLVTPQLASLSITHPNNLHTGNEVRFGLVLDTIDQPVSLTYQWMIEDQIVFGPTSESDFLHTFSEAGEFKVKLLAFWQSTQVIKDIVIVTVNAQVDDGDDIPDDNTPDANTPDKNDSGGSFGHGSLLILGMALFCTRMRKRRGS